MPISQGPGAMSYRLRAKLEAMSYISGRKLYAISYGLNDTYHELYKPEEMGYEL